MESSVPSEGDGVVLRAEAGILTSSRMFRIMTSSSCASCCWFPSNMGLSLPTAVRKEDGGMGSQEEEPEEEPLLPLRPWWEEVTPLEDEEEEEEEEVPLWEEDEFCATLASSEQLSVLKRSWRCSMTSWAMSASEAVSELAEESTCRLPLERVPPPAFFFLPAAAEEEEEEEEDVEFAGEGPFPACCPFKSPTMWCRLWRNPGVKRRV